MDKRNKTRKHFRSIRVVAILATILTIVGIMNSGSTLQSAKAQQLLPIAIQVEGIKIVLEVGKNVHPQTYDLLSRDPDFAALDHIRWIFIDDMWVPLARTESPPPTNEPSTELLVEPDYIPECKITLNVPAESQCDGRWSGNRLYQKTSCPTMCSAGCAITSASMVFRYYGSSKNAGQLNDCLGQNNCGDGCLLKWQCAAEKCSENKAQWVNYHSFSWGLLCSTLQKGRPPIVNVGNHFVVIYRELGNNPYSASDYYINDPADGSTYKKLSYYTNNPLGVAEYAKK